MLHARSRPGGRTSSPESGVLQARAAERPSGQHLAPAGRGKPLPDAVRAKMERALGHDFSRVRVHEGGHAESLGAIAYTRGTDLHFAPGRYSPATRGGQELIGHELAHVVQQQAGRVAVPQGKGAPINADPVLEAEADRLGRIAAAHHAVPAQGLGHSLARVAAVEAAPIQRNGKGKGKGGGSRKRASRTVDSDSDYEEESDPEPEDEEERRLDERGYGLDLGPSFSVVTSNVEKFGRGTERGRRDDKIEELSRVVAQSQPTLATFQEVSNPELFGHGEEGTRRRPGTTGLLDRQQPGGGTLGGQYAFLPGPSFQSGSYRESYPLLADTGLVHEPPKLSYFPGNSTEPRAYRGQTLPFGKAVDPTKKDPRSARPTTSWSVKIPTGRYNFRPPAKGWGSTADQRRYARRHRNLRHREIDYSTLNLLNVHTSPSISTITRQAAQIRAQHEALARDNPATLSAGDWYLQSGAKRTWSSFQRSDTLSLDEPGVQTNFPGKGTGQTADHFVSTRAGLTPGIVRALPRPTLRSQRENLAPEDYLREQAPVEELERWTDVGIDHAPVYASYDLRPRGGGPVRNRRQRRYSPY